MNRVLALAIVAAFAAGCSDSGSSNGALSALSTPSSASLVTDNFSGTVDVGGLDVHPFTITIGNQPVSVTLTAAGPPPSIFMGLGVGSPATDGTCSVFSIAAVVVQAGTGPHLSGSIAAGSYCVAVFDVGNQTVPVDYTVTVVHY
jgi:hypothetical protein